MSFCLWQFAVLSIVSICFVSFFCVCFILVTIKLYSSNVNKGLWHYRTDRIKKKWNMVYREKNLLISDFTIKIKKFMKIKDRNTFWIQCQFYKPPTVNLITFDDRKVNDSRVIVDKLQMKLVKLFWITYLVFVHLYFLIS